MKQQRLNSMYLEYVIDSNDNRVSTAESTSAWRDNGWLRRSDSRRGSCCLTLRCICKWKRSTLAKLLFNMLEHLRLNVWHTFKHRKNIKCFFSFSICFHYINRKVKIYLLQSTYSGNTSIRIPHTALIYLAQVKSRKNIDQDNYYIDQHIKYETLSSLRDKMLSLQLQSLIFEHPVTQIRTTFKRVKT